jgi:hypothetical protein
VIELFNFLKLRSCCVVIWQIIKFCPQFAMEHTVVLRVVDAAATVQLAGDMVAPVLIVCVMEARLPSARRCSWRSETSPSAGAAKPAESATLGAAERFEFGSESRHAASSLNDKCMSGTFN